MGTAAAGDRTADVSQSPAASSPEPEPAAESASSRAPVEETGRSRWPRAIWWIAGALAWVFLVATFCPLAQDVREGARTEWLLALNMLWGRPLRFGYDIVYTYSPWGVVWGGYYPTTFHLTCITWVFVATATWLYGWRLLSRPQDGGRWIATLAAVAFIAWTMTFAGESLALHDTRLYLLSLFVLLMHFFRSDPKRFDWAVGCVVVMCAFAGVIKFPYLVTGLLATGLVTLDQLLHRNYRPYYAMLFVATVLAAWRGAGQQVADWPAFFRLSLHMASTYAETMALRSPDEYLEVMLALASLSLLLVLLVLVTRSFRPVSRGLLLIGMAGLSWIVFRAGFVRHDAHELMTTAFAFTAAPAVWMAAWPMLRYRRRLHVAAGCCVLLAGVVYSRSTFSMEARFFVPTPLPLVRSTWQLVSNSARALAGKPIDPAIQFEEEMRAFRQMYPLPKIEGTVDFISTTTGVIAAHQLQYEPRPTLQGYAAYSPRLSVLNARKLAGPNAPENLLFQIDAIDGRLPSMDEGAVWVEILRHYELKAHYGKLLHLVRRARPRASTLRKYATITTQFGRPVSVPRPPEGGLVWAEVRFPIRMMSRLAGMAYKPPILALMLVERDGHCHITRLLPSNAAGGFILSPIVLTNDRFAQLLNDPAAIAADPSAATAGMAVAIEPGDPYAHWYYDGESISVAFYELTIQEPQ